MKLDFRQRLLATTLLVGASMVASPAFAQETAPPPPCAPDSPNCPPETVAPVEGTTSPSTSAEGEAVESTGDIIVTGSRIPQPNLTSASPVTVVTAQEVKLSGTTRTEDLINSLPQSFAAQGSNVSNGSTGTATVNLRGLGTARTMVLINGRRMHPGDPRAPAPDINFIPSSLIKRVDVLTGGASSVYGADAVAGVVNFIMDTEFRGLRIDGQASAFMHDNDANDTILVANGVRGFRPPSGRSVNGGAADISVAFGAGFDDNRGSIMAYATYRTQRPVLQASRDYSFCALAARATRQSGTPPRDFNCGGSATSATGTFFTNVGTFQVAGNQFVTGTTPFNFAPYNYYQRPDERYTLGAFAEYEIDDMFKPYLEAMFMDDHSDAQIAPSGNFFATTTINCDNPLLSTQQFNTICVPANTFVDANGVTQAIAYTGRRNVEGGGRDDDLRHTAYRLVGGLRGDLDKGLSYNVYGQYGTTKLSEIYRNDFSITRVGRAMDVIANPAVGGVPGVPAGTPVCRAAVQLIDANCVPWNIFASGGVTPEALAYLQTPGFSSGNVDLSVAQADLTILGGEYGLQSPWADRGISANVGGAYAKHSLKFEVDEAFRTGDLAGQGGPTPPVSGDYDVRELFGEVELPIITNSFIEEFTVRAGYRKSWYHVADNKFSTDTYKLEAELAPIKDVRLRGSYNRAVRAPNVIELFFPQSLGLAGNEDPCANDPITGVPRAPLAQCQNTGVSAAQYGSIVSNPANQYNALFGGNPDLSPETADSYTFGVVLQPRFIPGLAFTVDYFDITVKDVISAGIGFQTIMNQCLQSNNLCDFINRAPGSGSLWLSPAGFIELTNLNIGALRTTGIDVNGSYARQFGGMGNLSLSLVGTWLKELSTSTLLSKSPTKSADGAFECKGFYGGTCGTPNPKWRHKFRVGWTFPNGIGVSGQWRYFSAVKNDTLSADCDLNGGDPVSPGADCAADAFSFPGNAKLKSADYFDLALSARIGDRYNLRLGANNIFVREPPIAGGEVTGAPFGNGNSFPQVYDALGRFFFAGFTVDF
jgi:outer membrane receptor protein involved in Fe transport